MGTRRTKKKAAKPMDPWAAHFRERSRLVPTFSGLPSAGRFGSDVSDAVVAYRVIWNPYVMNTLRSMGDAATKLRIIAQNPPPGPITGAQLSALADDYEAEQGDLLAAWNEFSGTSAADFTAQADVILRAFQAVVAKVQKFWQEQRGEALQAAGVEPPQPSTAEQAAVQAKVNASGVLSLGSYYTNVLEGVAQKVPSLPKLPTWPSWADVEQFAKDHWKGIAVGVVAVGLGLKVVGAAGKVAAKVMIPI